MNTKFVYLFALLSLAMSSFAVASDNHLSVQGHYRTSKPFTALESNQDAVCDKAKSEVSDSKKSGVDCRSQGESGQPFNVKLDSACSCVPSTTSNVPGSLVCSFGVSWDCHFHSSGK